MKALTTDTIRQDVILYDRPSILYNYLWGVGGQLPTNFNITCMIIIQKDNETHTQLLWRCLKVAKQYGSCTMYYEGKYATIKFSDFIGKVKSLIRKLICVKDINSIRVGDKLSYSYENNVWFTPDGRIISDDQVSSEYFDNEFSIG